LKILAPPGETRKEKIKDGRHNRRVKEGIMEDSAHKMRERMDNMKNPEGEERGDDG
jgi:hypothetical protein